MAKGNTEKRTYYNRKKPGAQKQIISIQKKVEEESKDCSQRKEMLKQDNQSYMNKTYLQSTSNSRVMTSGPLPLPVSTVAAKSTTKDHISYACLSLIKKDNESARNAISNTAHLNNIQIENNQNITETESQINHKTTESSQDMDVDPHLINVLKTPEVNISKVNIIIEDSDNEDTEDNSSEHTQHVSEETFDNKFRNNNVTVNDTNTGLNSNDNLDSIKIIDCKSLIKEVTEASINDIELVDHNSNSNTSNVVSGKLDDIEDNNARKLSDSESSSSLVIDTDSNDPSWFDPSQNCAAEHNEDELNMESIKKRLRSAKARDKNKEKPSPKVRKISTSDKPAKRNEKTDERESADSRDKSNKLNSLTWLQSSLSRLESSLKALEEPPANDPIHMTKVDVMNQRLPNETDQEQWERMKDLAFNVYGVPKRNQLVKETRQLVQKHAHNEKSKEIHTPDILLPSWVKPNKITIKPFSKNPLKHATTDGVYQEGNPQSDANDLHNQSTEGKEKCQNQTIRTEAVKNKLQNYKLQTDKVIMGCMDQQLDILNKLNKITSTNGDVKDITPTLNKLFKVQSNMNRAHKTQSILNEIHGFMHSVRNDQTLSNSSKQSSTTPHASLLKMLNQILALKDTQPEATQTNSEKTISSQCGETQENPLEITKSEPNQTSSEQFISSQSGKIHINPLAITPSQLTETSSKQFISSQNGKLNINPLVVKQHKPIPATYVQFISTQNGKIQINPLIVTQPEATETNSYTNINTPALTQVNTPQPAYPQSNSVQGGFIEVHLPFTISTDLHSLYPLSAANPSQSVSTHFHQDQTRCGKLQSQTPQSLTMQTDPSQSNKSVEPISPKSSESDPSTDQNRVQLSDSTSQPNRCTSSLLHGVKLSEVPRWARTLMPLLLGQRRRAERLTRGARRKKSESLEQNLPMLVITQTPEGEPLLASGLCSSRAVKSLAAAFPPFSSPPHSSTSAPRTTCTSQRLASRERFSTQTDSRSVRIIQKQRRRIRSSMQISRKKMVQEKKNIRRKRFLKLRKKSKRKIQDQTASNEKDTENKSNSSHCSSVVNINQENTIHSFCESPKSFDQSTNPSANHGAINTNLDKHCDENESHRCSPLKPDVFCNQPIDSENRQSDTNPDTIQKAVTQCGSTRKSKLAKMITVTKRELRTRGVKPGKVQSNPIQNDTKLTKNIIKSEEDMTIIDLT